MLGLQEPPASRLFMGYLLLPIVLGKQNLEGVIPFFSFHTVVESLKVVVPDSRLQWWQLMDDRRAR
jgi:hypothetical protein